MLDDTTVQMLQQHWEDGWNRGEVDTIMAPVAPTWCSRHRGSG
jgi:hypothetical protein